MRNLLTKREWFIFIKAVGLYLLNKYWLSKVFPIPFMRNYFNDVMGGIVLEVFIVASARMWMRRDIDYLYHIIILLCAGVYWEYIAPTYITYSTTDLKDIIAYLCGGISCLILRRGKDEV